MAVVVVAAAIVVAAQVGNVSGVALVLTPVASSRAILEGSCTAKATATILKPKITALHHSESPN